MLYPGHLWKADNCKWSSVLWVLQLENGEGNSTPLQDSCLENPMDRGAWWAAVHGVSKSWTWLSDFTFTFHFHELEKEMATHSGVLAWRIPGMGEPGGLLSMGSHRVGHNWSNLAAAARKMNDTMKPQKWLPWSTNSHVVYYHQLGFSKLFCISTSETRTLHT